MTRRSAWVLSNGMIGMDNQSLGLAEALDLDVTIKTLHPAAPWMHLPPSLWLRPLHALRPGSDRIEPPWPDVVIGTGRLNVAASVAIARASKGRTRNVRVQHPRIALRHFDAIVVPEHDRCTGSHVIQTLGAVNRVTQARLDAAAAHFAPGLADLPRPFVTVLLGGNNSQYTLDATFAARLAGQIGDALRSSGGSVLITPSRRTPPELLQPVQALLQHYPGRIWLGSDDNPYFGWLALADTIVVTADSVNMASEAAFTGKPVYVSGLSGKNNKFERFHQRLQERGCTRPFAGELSVWQYAPLDETRIAATRVKQQLGW